MTETLTPTQMLDEIESLKRKIQELKQCESDRMLTEDALRTSQMRLSDAMELAHIVYWEFDPVTETYLFNDPFYAFYGTTAAREGGYRMSMEEYAKRFIYPDDLPAYFGIAEQNIHRNDTDFFIDVKHRILRRNGDVRHVLVRIRVIKDSSGNLVRLYGATQDITEQKLVEEEREKLIVNLQEALSQVKMLSGLLPICSSCKKIRNEQGSWEVLEVFIRDHSEADFSHGLCPECLARLYPGFLKNKE